VKCPRDGAELARLKILGLDLDKCHACDGLWCDRGELERLRDARRSNIEESIERIYGNPRVKPGKIEGFMRCPTCPQGRLQRQVYSFTQLVQTDRCETCLGVWLDDRELDAIIDAQKDLDAAGRAMHKTAILRALTAEPNRRIKK
jgi:Zn-finger nucleic acid-binding protein